MSRVDYLLAISAENKKRRQLNETEANHRQRQHREMIVRNVVHAVLYQALVENEDNVEFPINCCVRVLGATLCEKEDRPIVEQELQEYRGLNHELYIAKVDNVGCSFAKYVIDVRENAK